MAADAEGSLGAEPPGPGLELAVGFWVHRDCDRTELLESDGGVDLLVRSDAKDGLGWGDHVHGTARRWMRAWPGTSGEERDESVPPTLP